MYHGSDATLPDRMDLGPDSLLWRYAGDSRISFMGSSIGLLQLMHPAIGAGVIEHSNFFEDPADRIFRSLPWILGVVYDEDGEATGRAVRGFHKPIKGIDSSGRRYHALDPATYWWAHATFQYMAEGVADWWDLRRLTDARREQLYVEGVEWYRRYGVSDRGVPPDRAAFQVEFDRVCTEVLEMNEAVEFVLEVLNGRPLPPSRSGPRLPAPIQALLGWGPTGAAFTRANRLAAVGGLPRIVRERFDIPWSWRDACDLRMLEVGVRNGWRFVPRELAWQPKALEGWDRVRAQAALTTGVDR